MTMKILGKKTKQERWVIFKHGMKESLKFEKARREKCT